MEGSFLNENGAVQFPCEFLKEAKDSSITYIVWVFYKTLFNYCKNETKRNFK